MIPLGQLVNAMVFPLLERQRSVGGTGWEICARRNQVNQCFARTATAMALGDPTS